MAISFVGSSPTVAGANPTVAVPAGVIEKDLLLIITTGTATPATPVGWTAGNSQGATSFLTLFYKFANASESSVALTLAGSTSNAVMIAYRGASILSGFATSTAISTSITSVALTTLYDNQYVVNIFGANNVAGTWTAPASTTARVNSAAISTNNGLLVVDALQATAGLSATRTATITASHTMSSATFTIIPGGDHYWVGGTGTWNTTSTTNWSFSSGGTAGAPPPGPVDSVFFDQAGTYTVTMTGALTCGSMTTSAGTVTFATGTTPTLAVSGAMTLLAGTLWTNTGALNFTAPTIRTITTNGVTINSPITFIGTGGVAGTWTLGSALTTSTTVATTLTSGALNLNGFDLSTGTFSSNNTNGRAITWGTNSIYLTNTNAGQTVLDMATVTNYSFTGTPSFVSDASVTRTYTFGTTGGTSANSPNLSLTGSGTAVQTFTTGSWFGLLNFGTTAFNPGTTALNLDSLTLSSGGTFTTMTSTMVGSGTITSNTNTTLGALNINGTGITTSLGDTFTMSATSTVTLTLGTLVLNGFNLTTGIFSSSNSNVRRVEFGTNNIVLIHPTAATVVLAMAITPNFTSTSTGNGGFTADATVARTYQFASTTTGGNEPNLIFTGSGTAIQTLTTASWFNKLDFGTTAFNPGTTSLNITSLTLSTGGTYTGLSITIRYTGTINGNSKTIAALSRSQAGFITTFASALSCTTYTQTAGDIDFAGFNLTCSGAASYTAGTLINIGTISCTTWAETGTFALSSGTISASTSFTVTSGAFTYNGGTITTPSFVHTAGTVTTTTPLTLPATCTYTLTAGTLTLGGNLTTGAFSSTGTGVRSIAWGTYSITLNHSTAATTVLNMAIVTNYTFTGTQSFISDASVTRTYVFGTTGGTTSNAPSLAITSGAAVPTFTTNSSFNLLDFTGSSTTPAAASIYVNAVNLSTGGTYTSLGLTFRVTYTFNPNGKTIGNLGIDAGANITLAGPLGCSTYTQTAGTIDFAGYNLTGSGAASYTAGTLSNIGTITCTTWTVTGAFTFGQGTITPSTSFVLTSGSFTYNVGATLSPVPTFTHTAGTVTLNQAYALTATGTYSLVAGTLILGGNLTTGIFSSSNSNVRRVEFGSNNIILTHTTPATVVLAMAITPNFTSTATGVSGFTADATIARTYQFASTTTGGNEPNLIFTGSGTAVQTLTTASWFNKLDFGTTAFNPGTTSLNITSLTLSGGGTYTGLSVTIRYTGTITSNGKTIAALSRSQAGFITTLADALSCTTYTQTAGDIDFAGFNLTCSAGASYTAGTLSNIGTISCTTWTVTGAFTFGQGTITPSTSFVLTSGSFTYNVGATLSAVPTFTHTAGTVTLNQAYALTTTGTYSLVAGTLILGGNLTTGSFITTGTGVRAIQFSTNQITLTGNNATIWDGGGINITYTGTPTIVSNYTGSTGTRTINVGTGWTEATAFDVKTGSAVGISIGTSGTDIVAIAGNLDTLNLTGMNFTYSPGVMTVYVDYTIPATGGAVSASANTTTFASTNITPRVITVSRTIDFPITFSGVGGTFNLGDNFTTGATRTTTLTSGVLALNGYNYSTGLFSSAGALARTISFGSNSITVSGTGTVWTTATITNLTISGTPVVNVTNASATATTVLPGALPESQSISYNFTAGSYALTFLNTAGYTADNVNFTGFVGTLAATAACTVYGNYTLSSGMTVTASANVLTFGATSGTNIITTSGKTVPPIAINGLGGTFNISGSLTTSGLFQVLAGTFSTTISNHNITCTQFDSSTNTSARSISLNGSTVTISGTAGITLDSTNLTFNAGTSQITLTNATSTVISSVGGGTFYNVSCTGGGTVALSTVNTYNNLTLTNGPAVPSVVTVSDTQTINGVFASVSTNASTRLTVQSVIDGVQETISAGSVSLTDVDFQDIYAAGATIPWTGTRLGNLGNDTNITFGTSNTRYWSLAAGGNWNAVAWATSSGGTPSVDNFPLPQDTCIIENTGLNTSATITINANWNIGSINMSSRTNAMTLAIGVTTPFIYGSWINGSGYTITGTGTVNFVGQDAVQTITGLAITFTPNININTVAQTVQLGSALTMGATSTLTLTSGILSLNGYNLTTGIFSSNNTNTRTIQFGSNNITLSHTTAATTVLSMANATGFNYTGTGGFTSGMSVTRTFTCATTASVSGSVLLNGTSQYLNTTAINLTSVSAFTVETWIYLTADSASQQTIVTTRAFGAANGWEMRLSSARIVQFYFTGVTWNSTIDSTTTIELNTWYHLAFVRDGSSATLYVNGIAESTATGVTNGTSGGGTYIGNESGSSNYFFNGYISNLRIVNGVTVYTGNFTPSPSPLTATQPASTNISAITGTQTSLLLNTPNNASFLSDTSTNNFTVTNNGGATSNASTPITVLPAAGVPPNLAINSGASIPTISSGSTFNILDFTGSTCIPAATVVNLNSNLVLASGGTYTALSVSMNGAGTNTITGNSKTIAALTFTAGTNSIIGALTCTTFNINGPDFNFDSGTLTPTTSFTLTSGSFTYGGTATLSAVPTFTQTAGTVTFSKVYALTATGTYTLTSGTLTLNGFDLTTGIFSSSNSNNRTIEFGTNNIILSTTTAAATVLSMADTTGFLSTGTGGFTSPMSVTRTFTVGTVGASTGSLLFNGSSGYLTRVAATPFIVGTSDFTIEVWMRPNSVSGTEGIWVNTSAPYIQFRRAGTEISFQGSSNTTTALVTSGAELTVGVWTHVAVVRISGFINIYIDGVSKASRSFSTNFNGTGNYNLGVGSTSNTTFFTGYLSNFRLVKGIGVYTGTFTPPVSPLTATQSAGVNISAITGTQTGLLFNTPNNSAYKTDSSSYNYVFTVVGGVTANALTPITVLPAGGVPPNLALTSGASIPTITTGGTFNILDFTGSTCIPAATVVNVINGLTLASGGTYTSLGVTSIGPTSIITNAKTIAALLISYNGNPTLTGSLGCTTLTVSGGYFDLSNTVTLTPSSTITITAGTFIYGGTATLASVATFTQTAGTVTLKVYSLTATGTYTFTSGTLTLTGDLTTGIFSSNNTNTRTIFFDVYNIILSHTTLATTVLSMASTTGFFFTGTGGFTSPMSVTRSFNVGTAATTSGSLFFNNSTSRLTYTTTTPLIIGTSNFTVEAWINLSNTSGNQTIWSTDSGIGFVQMVWRVTGTELQIFYNSSGVQYSVTTTGANLTIGIWTHIAFVRISGVVNIYVNGISKVNQSYSYSFSGSGTSAIGTLYGGTSETFFGYISNFRLVKGIGVYTGTFTPSPSPLTAVQSAGTNISAITGTQTSLLLNTPDNVLFITDSSSYNFVATNTDVVANASTPITVFPAGGVPPNLAINSGASIPTIVSGSTLNILDFTGSTCTPATATINMNDNLLLASGGTYTALSFTFRDTATITTNSKTIAALTINASSSTITQSGALSCTTFTLTNGTMDFSTNNLTCSGAATYTGGSLINLGTLSCTTFTINGPNYTFSSGTITPSTSFTLTSGEFTYNSPAVLSAVPTFTQTAGNVSLNQAYSLSATGTYTLSSGTLSLGGTLTTGIFSSSNTNLRSISFGTNNIVLSHTTAAQTVLNMANESNFSYTGTGGFTSPMSVTRTFTSGTIGAVSGSLFYTGGQRLSLAASSAFDLSGGTWTVEFWMNSTAAPTVGNSCRIFMFGANNTFTGYDIAYNSDGSLLAAVPRNSISAIGTAAGVISLNAWYHVAIVSNAGSAYIYVNGVAVAGPVTILQPTTSSPTLFIGYDTALTVDFQYQGYLSNIRITKGVAVYTGNFTVPVSPLNATQSAGTNISAITGTQTSLLLNTPNNAYFLTDNSTNNFTVTNNGSITAVALTPITVLPAAGQAPNLALTSGASVPTLTTGSAFNILDFTGSSTTPPATSLSIASALTLSSGGTYTGLTISSTSATSITGNNKTIAALSLNNGSSTTTVDTTGLVVTGDVTMTQGSLSLNGNISSGRLVCSGSPRTITGTNTTYSITGSGTSAWNYSPSGSAVFNGSTQYLSMANNAALNAGTGDFTIEAWVYIYNYTLTNQIYSVADSSGGGTTGSFAFGTILTTGRLFFGVSATDYLTTTGPIVPLNTWSHIALVRSGTTYTVWLNGVSSASTVQTLDTSGGGEVRVGRGRASSANYFAGNISNLRMVKGVAVYTGTFAVPTGPLTATQTANPYGGSNTSAITGTQTALLLNTRNYYDYTTDSSTNNFTVTNNNGVTYNVSSPTFTTGTSGFTCSGFTINMTSATAKTFVGGIGTYPVLNHGGGAALTISGTNTFDNITNTISGSTITFPTATTTTFNNFSLYGSSTGGGASTGYPLGSVSLNGTSQYLSSTRSGGWVVSGNFTVEAFIYLTAYGSPVACIAGQSAGATASTVSWEFYVASSTAIAVNFKLSGVSSGSVTGSATINLNTWYHVAFSRSGTTVTLFVNGVVVGSGTISSWTSQNILTIGFLTSDFPYRFPGYISNFRIVNGVSVYTGNFTVPTDPLTTTQSAGTNIAAITGTQTTLLLNTPNSASFITDSSVNNYAITNTGTATANNLSPFLCYITSSTSGTSATITKSSGVVYGSALSIKDSNATGGATWYAGPTSVSVSNNTGWIFNQLPIINMSNVSIDGGVTFSNDPI